VDFFPREITLNGDGGAYTLKLALPEEKKVVGKAIDIVYQNMLGLLRGYYMKKGRSFEVEHSEYVRLLGSYFTCVDHVEAA
jgi:hypothetical protein